MSDFLSALGTFRDLVLFLLGFGLIVFVHELGHFAAARWAGVRVLAFAIGFGPPLISFRKGLGFRRGSSEKEYLAQGGGGRVTAGSLSPTEYRLNWLPFGGYVKMLGQDDLDPTAVSSAPDSYQNCNVFKRMVIICAGVVMNIIFALAVFGIVFHPSVGLNVSPPKIGYVAPGGPASMAVAANAARLGVTESGLKPGDTVVSIDDDVADEFQDVMVGVAMSSPGTPVNMRIRRAGIADDLLFSVKPEKGRLSGLLEIGVEPARSATLPNPKNATDFAEFKEALEKLHLVGVEPGMTLIRAGAIEKVASAEDLARAMNESGGKPVRVVFASPNREKTVAVELEPTPALMKGTVRMSAAKKPGEEPTIVPVEHLLGLMPVMAITNATPNKGLGAVNASDQGLKDGDVFARIGAIEFPSVPQGMAEIKAHAGSELAISVLRPKNPLSPSLAPGGYETVDLKVKVSSKGMIGFLLADTASNSTLISRPAPEISGIGMTSMISPSSAGSTGSSDPRNAPPAAGVFTVPGTTIVRVGDDPVRSFPEIREALRRATKSAFDQGAESATVGMAVNLPTSGVVGGEASDTIRWTISKPDIAALHALRWESPLSLGAFVPEEIVLKGATAFEAVGKGFSRTKNVMAQTYLTFARLFQRSVKVEHLKGPVGIAHMGTLVAEKGFIWMLFFLGLISVNLAVINFLPLPIVDGGQFLLLLFEALRGKPAPVQFQNAITMAGLVMIGCVFLVVTFNDIRSLLGL
jgi:regulator of sigma E protease